MASLPRRLVRRGAAATAEAFATKAGTRRKLNRQGPKGNAYDIASR